MGKVAELFKAVEGIMERPAAVPARAGGHDLPRNTIAGAASYQPPRKAGWLNGPSYRHAALSCRDHAPA